MDEILLVTRPKYDDGTEYLSAYALLIIKRAKESNIKFKDFEGEHANKNEVEKYLRIKNPKFLFLNGHGSKDEIFGHKNVVIFSVSENLHFLKDRLIYARACFSAYSLGEKAVENNSGCFIGYTYPFSFWVDDKWSAKPLNDKTAALYLEPSNEIVFSLLKGWSAKDADERSRKMMIENMKKILTMKQKNEPGAMNMLQILWDNYNGQIVVGNDKLTFFN